MAGSESRHGTAAQGAREAIRPFLRPGLSVLAVEDGTESLAFWLAAEGHHVHLVVRSPRSLSEALLRHETIGPSLASLALGDARVLEQDDGSVDVVVLNGPLSTLPSAAHRHLALAEAHRVLGVGGVLLALAHNRLSEPAQGAHAYLPDELLREAAIAGFAVQPLIGVVEPDPAHSPLLLCVGRKVRTW